MPHLSKTEKMVCLSWGIPAKYCQTGSKLRAVSKDGGKMNPCGFCYAFSGRIIWGKNQEKLQKNLDEWKEDRVSWVTSICWEIERKDCRHFRWFHSGDLQGLEMLLDIVQVAEMLPGIKFWLPTQERVVVSEFLKLGKEIPTNLNIRISSPLVDIKTKPFPGTTTSMVGLRNTEGVDCPARHFGGNCGTCRACWDKEVPTVTYPLKIGAVYRPEKYKKVD